MFPTKTVLVLFILIFMQNVLLIKCFDVNFRAVYDVKIEDEDVETEGGGTINKRDMTQFFDKASFSFNGFNKTESVPVMFPLDICLLSMEGVRYATSLHTNKNDETSFAVFRLNLAAYELLVDIAMPNAIAMDCKSLGAFGYVAIALNITEPIENARQGSPIYEIAGDRVRAVQYFATPNMRSVHLRVTGSDLFLLQAFDNTQAMPNLNCPYFKWSGSTFNKLGYIPCSNARNLQPFSIDYEQYVAVANYADQHGRTSVNSEIYKFNRATQKFHLLQKIKTNGAVDVQYFKVPQNSARNQHFLIFGNSLSKTVHGKPGEQLEADSVFYQYDKGQFVPYQSISLYAVEKFLPIENEDAEKFLLLVACSNQDIKIYNLNDWKFEVSNVQYTEGALGKGVAKMRVYKEQGISYLVIANEHMADNETNIFQPIFKQEEHANMLREEIINWSKANFARLAAVDMEKLQQDVVAKLAKHKTKALDLKEIPSANISNVITKSLTYAPMHFNSDYWLALRYAKKALDVLETLYPAEPRLQKRQLKQNANETIPDNLEYEFKEMHLKTLIVRDKLKAKMVNGVSNTDPILKSIKAKEIKASTSSRQATTEQQDQLNVEHLQLNGKLNGLTWSDLLNNTLKREAGVQFIKSSAQIGKLKTKSVSIASNLVNGKNLGQLVRIDGGNYVVNQEVQFAERIKAKDVIINDRLNNIHVHKQKFDVLLKRSNDTQIIEGFKVMENLRVLEPITLAGQMLGAHLQEMQPNKAIHEPLVLQGDYTIAGDVTIKKLLKAKDLVHLQQGKRSIGELLHNGIQMAAEPLQDVRLNFAMPIVANNTLVSFINGEDMQELVRTNDDEVQVIEAQKSFKQSLAIEHGVGQVKHLNGIDTERLEEQFLTKHTNQRLPMAMHFGRVLAKSYNSSTIQLNGKPLDAYLRHTGDQKISAPLKIEQLMVKKLDVARLNTNGQIFGVPLEDIYQQRAKIAPIESIFKQYFNGSVYVRNLLVNSSINGKPVGILEQQLNQIDGNIKYVGNYHFNYPMTIANLTFEGALNGIRAEQFGKCWLQKHGKQSFTAPQTLASVQAKRGVMLKGKINSHELEDFYEQTYWLSRDERFGDVQFVNPIEMQGVLRTQQLNDLSIPEDILFRQAAQPQKLHAPLTVHGQTKIHGHIKNITKINSHNLAMLQSFLSSEHSQDRTLHVEHAKFSTAPMYRTLNRHNLRRCLEEAWLANENVVLHHDVEIADAYFTGLLDFEGPINNMDLNYLQDNYVSLTRPQDIQTELSFMDTVQFDEELSAEHVYLHGPVQELQSNVEFDFAKFVANTLKNSAAPQEITGSWHLQQVQVHGNLQNVLVNGLNMASDVVQVGMPLAVITAPKRLKRAQIQKLHATPLSTINKVPIASWIKDTVYLYDNVTIYGTTTMDAINLFSDLSVRGSVNGQRFHPDNLLLRSQPQLIHGNVHINNAQPVEQRFLTNNIESLNVDYVNDRAMGEFFDNVAVLNSTLEVHGHLVFEQALNVRSLENKHAELVDFKQVKRSAVEQELENAFDDLQHEVDDLKNAIKVSEFRLDHFRLLQTIPQAFTEGFVYSQPLDGVMVDFIGFLNGENNQTVQTYYYQKESEKFLFYKVLDIQHILQEVNDQWKLQKYQVLSDYLKASMAEAAADHVMLQIGDQNCMASYGNEQQKFEIYCQRDEGDSPTFKRYAQLPRADVKQVLNLNDRYTALLFSNGLEIWDVRGIKMKQRIKQDAAVSATHTSLSSKATYIAVISANGTWPEQQAQLSIYRSSFNGSAFVHLQSLSIPMPLDIVMSSNAYTTEDDLLLYLVTASDPQKLLIYQYNGVMGFELLAQTTHDIPVNVKKLEVLRLPNAEKSVLALLGSGRTVFFEIVYRML